MNQLRGADRLERAVLDQRLLEADAPGDILHLDKVVVPIRAQVVDRHDVRVHQIGDHPGLGPELLADLRLAGDQARVEHLDRARSAEELVLGLVDPGHRAVAESPGPSGTARGGRPVRVVDRGKTIVDIAGSIHIALVGGGGVSLIVDGPSVVLIGGRFRFGGAGRIVRGRPFHLD